MNGTLTKKRLKTLTSAAKLKVSITLSRFILTAIIASHVSHQSTQSYQKRMKEAKNQAENRPEWDTGSMTSEARQKKAENKMAQ